MGTNATKRRQPAPVPRSVSNSSRRVRPPKRPAFADDDYADQVIDLMEMEDEARTADSDSAQFTSPAQLFAALGVDANGVNTKVLAANLNNKPTLDRWTRFLQLTVEAVLSLCVNGDPSIARSALFARLAKRADVPTKMARSKEDAKVANAVERLVVCGSSKSRQLGLSVVASALKREMMLVRLTDAGRVRPGTPRGSCYSQRESSSSSSIF
jgi:hypothetical protein